MANKLINLWVAICYIVGFGNFGYGLMVGRTPQALFGMLMMIVGFAFDKKFLMGKNEN